MHSKLPTDPSSSRLSRLSSGLASLYDRPALLWDFISIIVPLVLLSPLAIVELQRMLGSAERMFVPLLLGFVAFEVVRALSKTDSLTAVNAAATSSLPRMRGAFSILCLAIATGAFAWWALSPWFAYVASAICFLAWTLGRFPALPWWRGGAWFGLILATIRFPVDWDLVLMTRMQGFSAWACDKALDALWVPHLRAASIIELPGKEFFVEEACSGVTSLFALFAFATLSLYLRGHGVLSAILSLSTVPLWAIAGNFFRLLVITLGYHHFDRDLAFGLDHELLGVASFALSVFGYGLSESIIRLLLEPVSTTRRHFDTMEAAVNRAFRWPHRPQVVCGVESLSVFTDETLFAADDRQRSDARSGTSPESPFLWSQHPAWLSSLSVLLVVLGGLALTGTGKFARANAGLLIDVELPDVSELDLETFPNADRLPERLEGGWGRVDYKKIRRPFKDPMGQNSLTWTYAQQDKSFLVSLDFPYRGPHGLEYCYHFAGWTVNEVAVVDDDRDSDWPFVELTLRNDLGFSAYVCYATFSDRGQPVRLLKGAAARLTGSRQAEPILPICYQVQLLRESPFPLTAAERREMANAFVNLRDRLLADFRTKPWRLSQTGIESISSE